MLVKEILPLAALGQDDSECWTRIKQGFSAKIKDKTVRLNTIFLNFL